MGILTAFALALWAATGISPDPRNILNGYEIPSEGYCDQPYIVVNDLGEWVCTLTTGPGAEGNDRQHVVATISRDAGKTWSPLIPIEPQDAPEASWVMPLKTPSGRIYAFYTFNAEDRREVLQSNGTPTKRVDTLGEYAFRYSDDGGHTWSTERYTVPIRAFDIDRENAYGGEVRFFWGVGKPMIHDGAAFIGLAKVGAFGQGFIERSEGFFLRSDNILTEPDPNKLRWETLPDGDIGLRAPAGPIAEEQNLVRLSDGSLFCTYRTTDGHPCHAYSRDGGHTWTASEYMTYTPGGRKVKHPRAANFVRRFSNGKFLYWFHNHGGKTYDGRNPVWLSGGIEKDGHIHWSQPEIVLYDDTPGTRMSYPDFIEQDGHYYISETQKSVARIHEVDRTLLEGLWNQRRNETPATGGLVLYSKAEDTKPGKEVPMMRLPGLRPGGGFTLDLWLDIKSAPVPGELLTTLDANGAGIAVSFAEHGRIGLTLSNGAIKESYSSDAGVLSTPGLHHVAMIVDGGPRIATFVVDGILCDGGEETTQGWYRVNPALLDCNGRGAIRIADAPGVSIVSLRMYNRYLRTSEAVGNWRAGFHTPMAEGETHDVVVYGGTAGGAITAIAAAKEGLSVVLLEPGQHIGGMVSGGLGRTDHGNKAVIGGMSLEFFQRVGKHYGEEVSWFFEPHVAEQVFRDWLAEAGVTVVFGQRVDAVDMKGARLIALAMEDGTVYRGRIFVDASYEADLLPRAGISYTWGRESQSVYNESLAGRIERSPKHQFPGPIDPYAADGTLLPLIYWGPAGDAGQGDRKVQAYNFRLCLTNRESNRLPFPKPEGYDPARYELLKRYLTAYPDLRVENIMIPSPMPEDKTDVNNNGAISTDYIGGSWEYPEADYARRAEIWKATLQYIQGFLYFIANDPSVPPALQAEMNTWGLSADEFQDTDHWPHQMYIREARRMIGEYVMHQQDLQTERTKEDSIGMGSYNSDSHHVQRVPARPNVEFAGDAPAVVNEGDMQVPVQPYEIAYRALTPKRAEAENLLVPVCCSASHVAYSSIRMEPQYMIMGQACGMAAALALRDGVPVQDVPVAALRERLSAQGQVLKAEEAKSPYFNAKDLPGIVLDNPDAEAHGVWRRASSVGPYVGFDYIHQGEDASGDCTLRYVPKLPKAGRYEVRFGYTAHPNRATNVPITVHTANGPVEIAINERETPGALIPFVSLGVFEFNAAGDGAVEVRTKGVDGYVVADAVQWLPVE
ncbi:MAG: FAD-dependent oxidoreductase [Candidatus Hydrogenedentes bacterium]|nr:FAD-dependent oxidoreductase [Candidatus Hydrogenedentota bacterium]